MDDQAAGAGVDLGCDSSLGSAAIKMSTKPDEGRRGLLYGTHATHAKAHSQGIERCVCR